MKTSFELIVFSNVYDYHKRKKARTTTLFGFDLTPENWT
jgi:hypothetical protein